jgi:hypothetical protein
MLVVAFVGSGALGTQDWFLLRAAIIWLVGTAALVQWRVAPLLRILPPRPRPTGRLGRLARHPLGSLLLGIVAVAPLFALGTVVVLLMPRHRLLPLPTGEWQLAALESVFLGGLTGLAIWEGIVGRVARRRANSRRLRRQTGREPRRADDGPLPSRTRRNAL